MSIGAEIRQLLNVSRETSYRISQFADLLIDENARQNLVSRATIDHLWERHIVDSAQLLRHGPADAHWLDVGSGPGLPGLVLAMLGVRHITLVEPRRLRTDFLSRCVDQLGLDNVSVVTGKAEQIVGSFDVITARAVAPLGRLFEIGAPLLKKNGRWVLPKGRSARIELEAARATWQGRFELVASVTDPEAWIVVADQVSRTRKAKSG